MAALHILLPLGQIVEAAWRLLGSLPLALGVALNLAADRAFKQADTTVKPGETSTALVTTGVFRWSRNPMYLGFVLILLGVAVLLGSAAPFVVVAAFPLLLDTAYVRPEERMLQETFSEAWEAYRRRTRRWL